MSLPIAPLDDRKQAILKAVVIDYVQTAEPIGSHTLLARHVFNVKSATIRNEMAELSELGYLCQPHTSAGRIPSDMGYRFYVDRLMDCVGLTERDASRAKHRLEPRRTEIDIIIEQSCRILADLAQYASVATKPLVKDARISHVGVTSVGHRKLLAVVVLSNGAVIHELLEFDPESKKIDPVKASNFLMEQLEGKTVEALSSIAVGSVTSEAADFTSLLEKVLHFVQDEVESASDVEVHLEGANYIFQQPEFKDVDRLEALLTAFEQRSDISRLFSRIYADPETTVIIGSENPVGAMRVCSFVGTKYRISGRVAGTIGVVGPTRMDYPRAIGAVAFMARNLGDMLERLMV